MKIKFDAIFFLNYNRTMRLSKEQVDLLARYFSDISKILVASTVIGFFVPGQGLVTFPVFTMGLISAVACLAFSLQLTKNAL